MPCREDSFAAHNRSSAPLKAEDHRHLLRAAQRSASVPPPQRQMLDEYSDSSRGVPLSISIQLLDCVILGFGLGPLRVVKPQILLLFSVTYGLFTD